MVSLVWQFDHVIVATNLDQIGVRTLEFHHGHGFERADLRGFNGEINRCGFDGLTFGVDQDRRAFGVENNRKGNRPSVG